MPHAGHLILTWRCNLKCGGCRSWERTVDAELDAPAWDRVFRQLPSLDVVKIIGGEPFARADLPDVVESLRSAIDPMVVQLVTNGTLTGEVVEFVRRHAWPRLHLRVSLDGFGESHDRARGVPGSFERTLQTLTEAAWLRRERPFQLAVNFTVTDESLPEMDRLVAHCRTLGVDVVPGFRVRPFLKHCNVANEEVTAVDIADRARALEHLVRPDHGAHNGFVGIEQRVLALLNRVVFGKHAEGGRALKFACQELRHLIYLNPRGELITCGLNHEPLGSLAVEGFDKVWNSPRARAARTAVEACPGCMQGAVEIMSRLYG